MSTVSVEMVEFEPRSARFAPVKYLFTRRGLVRVSVGKPENGPIGTRVENAIEVALPFVDDFSQNHEPGETTELEVSWIFCLHPRPSQNGTTVYLQTGKSGKVDLCPNVATQTYSRALGERACLHPNRNRDNRRADGRKDCGTRRGAGRTRRYPESIHNIRFRFRLVVHIIQGLS